MKPTQVYIREVERDYRYEGYADVRSGGKTQRVKLVFSPSIPPGLDQIIEEARTRGAIYEDPRALRALSEDLKALVDKHTLLTFMEENGEKMDLPQNMRDILFDTISIAYGLVVYKRVRGLGAEGTFNIP
ncbi:MAG: hypothetical protein AABY07_03805 [Nanoarchaeota archaeon]